MAKQEVTSPIIPRISVAIGLAQGAFLFLKVLIEEIPRIKGIIVKGNAIKKHTNPSSMPINEATNIRAKYATKNPILLIMVDASALPKPNILLYGSG